MYGVIICWKLLNFKILNEKWNLKNQQQQKQIVEKLDAEDLFSSLVRLLWCLWPIQFNNKKWGKLFPKKQNTNTHSWAGIVSIFEILTRFAAHMYTNINIYMNGVEIKKKWKKNKTHIEITGIATAIPWKVFHS